MKGARELNGVNLDCLASRNNLLSHRKRTLNYIPGLNTGASVHKYLLASTCSSWSFAQTTFNRETIPSKQKEAHSAAFLAGTLYA